MMITILAMSVPPHQQDSLTKHLLC